MGCRSAPRRAPRAHAQRPSLARSARARPRRRYYGSWVEGDPPHLHILLEFCDGGDLQQAIRAAREAKSFFSEELVTSWFCQLSSAILFCHKRRVLHRDLKAGNIFLHGPGRVVKLADFGIARVLHSEGSLASTVIGTPYYMRRVRAMLTSASSARAAPRSPLRVAAAPSPPSARLPFRSAPARHFARAPLALSLAPAAPSS